jgi:ABC-type transporter Mla subunit MlaD
MLDEPLVTGTPLRRSADARIEDLIAGQATLIERVGNLSSDVSAVTASVQSLSDALDDTARTPATRELWGRAESNDSRIKALDGRVAQVEALVRDVRVGLTTIRYSLAIIGGLIGLFGVVISIILALTHGAPTTVNLP